MAASRKDARKDLLEQQPYITSNSQAEYTYHLWKWAEYVTRNAETVHGLSQVEGIAIKTASGIASDSSSPGRPEIVMENWSRELSSIFL